LIHSRVGRQMLLLLAGALIISGCSDPVPAASAPSLQVPPTAAPISGPLPEPAGGGSAPPCTVSVEPGWDVADVAARQPEGAVICFGPGLYSVPHTIEPKASQTLRGSEGTVLTGEIPVEGWRKDGEHWAVSGYLPPDYEKVGQCEDTSGNPCQVAETFFLDGRPLRRVMSRDAVDDATFFADYSANVIYLGRNPRGQAATLARTRTAIGSTAPNVSVEKLTIRGFANLAQKGAVLVGGRDWTVRNSVITANHGVGIMIVRAENARITGNTITANGQMGIGQYRSVGGRIDNNRIIANNTAEFWRADWESGGIKVTKSSSTIANNEVSDNLGVGIWIDEAGDGVSILSNDIQGNAACGVRYEISRNGRIIGNTIKENALALKRGAGTNVFTGAGITVNTSSDVTIEDNSVSGNLNGIGVQARPRGDGPWGEYVLDKISVKGNQIDLRSPVTATTGYVESKTLLTPPSAGSVTFQGNHYHLTDPVSARFNLKDGIVDFRAWQAAGNDIDGTVTGS